ncbi:hypothetical protein HZA96_05880 [Candidatus Woesearchaeota archaeon]|nr:hypothetical protein [Candidatus Woesearchaeota archaeon]
MALVDDVERVLGAYNHLLGVNGVKADLASSGYFLDLANTVRSVGYSEVPRITGAPLNVDAYYRTQICVARRVDHQLFVVNRRTDVHRCFEFYDFLESQDDARKILLEDGSPNVETTYQMPGTLTNMALVALLSGIFSPTTFGVGALAGTVLGVGLSISMLRNPNPNEGYIHALFSPGHAVGKAIYNAKNITDAILNKKAMMQDDPVCLWDALQPYSSQTTLTPPTRRSP